MGDRLNPSHAIIPQPSVALFDRMAKAGYDHWQEANEKAPPFAKITPEDFDVWRGSAKQMYAVLAEYGGAKRERIPERER